MEKRRYKRKTFHLSAERISGDKTFAVFIENLSENGIYMITAPSDSPINFTPRETINIKLKFSSGEVLNLKCKEIWSYKTHPSGLTCNVGMEIIEAPAKYKEFIKTLR
jgi:hypothetical protein